MRACFQITERSLFYEKTVPASVMRACFQIAERSLFYEKNIRVRTTCPDAFSCLHNGLSVPFNNLYVDIHHVFRIKMRAKRLLSYICESMNYIHKHK